MADREKYLELASAVARVSSDEMKMDLELRCDRCGTHVCDIEPGDSLDVLARTFLSHENCYGEDAG